MLKASSEHRRLIVAFAAATLAGCAGGANGTPGLTPGFSPAAGALVRQVERPGHVRRAVSLITHVVIIVQENRTLDNLFNGFPGANTQNYGTNSYGDTVSLQPVSMTAPYDLSHAHPAFVTEYANGNLNGFNNEPMNCSKNAPPSECPAQSIAAYGYVPQSQTQPYWQLATEYTLADNMFATNQGPSFPAHQYLVSGTSTISNGSTLRASENPRPPGGGITGGCDAPKGSTVAVIDQNGNENRRVFPCFDRISLMQEADSAYLSWRYYQDKPGAGLWHAVDALKNIRDGNAYSNVVTPSSQVLNDIANGNLANIVWVTPTTAASDHPGGTNGSGPSWVASIVNAIGQSPYWYTTAIFVTWDDWGGWYDHVAPPMYNSYELGFRVPLLVISPYAKQGYVSHVQHEFASILKFTEEAFGLQSMGTTDARADDLSDCFNFQSPMRKFKHIRAPHSRQYFLHQPPSNEPPDDDW